MAVIAEHAMHRLSGRLDAWPLTSWHRSRGGIAHSCPHTVVTAARCLQWGGCVRALGMPGLPTRAVSSALPERPKAEGLWGHRDCMRISAHIWVGARCAWVSCERVYTDPWSRPRRARRARGWLRVSVQVRSRVIQYMIYLTQTQTARPRDLPVAARTFACIHRARARTRLWAKGDRSAKRRRVTETPYVPNMGTFSLKPFTQNAAGTI